MMEVLPTKCHVCEQEIIGKAHMVPDPGPLRWMIPLCQQCFEEGAIEQSQDSAGQKGGEP